MAKNKYRSSRWGWWLVALIIILIAILIYPSVFLITQNKVQTALHSKISQSQQAVAACYNQNNRQLRGCSNGENGIPTKHISWFGLVKSIHIYQGVIQVQVKMNLGEPLFIYYIPRPIPRRWLNSSTDPKSSLIWQRIESNYCGLDSNIYSCRNFMKYSS